MENEINEINEMDENNIVEPEKKPYKLSKKKLIKFSIIVLSVIIFIIILITLIKYLTSDYHKLTKLGYDKETSKKIVEMNKSDKVLSIGYNEKILDIMTSKYYIDKNLENYLNYYENNKNKTIDDVIAIVNVHADNEFYSLKLKTDTDLGNAMLVNKYYSLDESYEPELVSVKNWYAYGDQKVTEEVYDNYIRMFEAAEDENIKLIINDSYRSYEEQKETHKLYGDTIAARPGSSEHNTGLSIDIITYGADADNFDKTEAFRWLSKNAHKYGFILRYPKDKEYLTGYDYESWHYRYLGVDLATKVYESGLTYEEYYAYYIENK